jgi:hypothetical protein
MEFEYLNQPDFDRERDETVKELIIKLRREQPQVYCPEGTLYRFNLKVAQRSYNEGYKQAVRDLKSQRPPLDGGDYDELIDEIDEVDKEDT